MSYQPCYPTPLAPAAGETRPRLQVEATTITANATGLTTGAITWEVDGLVARGARTNGPLLRAKTTAKPCTVKCLVDGQERWIWTVHPLGSGDWEKGVQIVARTGKTVTLAISFAAALAGEHKLRFEQLDDGPRVIPDDLKADTRTLAAGETWTPSIPITVTSETTRHRDFVFRLVVLDPAGVLHVRQARYVRALPRVADAPAYQWPDPLTSDQRLPVPAGPLGARIQEIPLMQPGDDSRNPTFGSDQAVAELAKQVHDNGFGFNTGGYGIVVVKAPVGKVEQAGFYDAQYKLSWDAKYALASGGQLAVPSTTPVWAVPPTASDGTMCVYMPDGAGAHHLSEQWKWRFTPWGHYSAHGARIDLATNKGVFDQGYGVSAAGISQAVVVPDVFVMAEAARLFLAGKPFRHLFTSVVPVALPRVRSGGVTVYPANRSDGVGTVGTEPIMGMRYRMKSSIKLEEGYTAGTYSLAEVLWGARMQERGIIIMDTVGPTATAQIVAQTYPYARLDGQPDPWSELFAPYGGMSIKKIDVATMFEAVKPGSTAGEPTSMVMPPAVELAPAPVYALRDDFNRTVAAGSWGNAPTGGAWEAWGSTDSAAPKAGVSVDGSAGVIVSSPSSGSGFRSTASVQDQQIDLIFSLGAKPTSQSAFLSLFTRKSTGGSIKTQVTMKADGTITLQQLADLPDPTADFYLTTPVTAVSSWTAGQMLHLRVTVRTTTEPDGTTKRIATTGALWVEGQAEPATPTVTGSSANASLAPVTGAGSPSVELWWGTETGNQTMRVDSFTVVDLSPAAPPVAPTNPTGPSTVEAEGATALAEGATVTITDTMGG